MLLACLLLPACKGPSASRPESQAPLMQEAKPSRYEVRILSGGLTLRGWLLKPAGTGPFPSLVYNHGSEREPSLTWMGATADYFQAHGYVALFPFRRGSGGSEGPHWLESVRNSPGPPGRALIEALEAENADVVAAVDWLQRQPFVDGKRVAVAGCSFGGIHTVLAAEKPIGLLAAIDFAGAAMSWQRSPALQERLKRAVRHAQTPIFFVQAANDFDTTPSQVLSAEMTREGKPNHIKIYPPHGGTPMEGHAHFCNYGQSEWGDDVLAFLRQAETRSKPTD